MFLEKINHVTGEREWVVADENYDLCQELARSRFGDMILDYDRNDKFLAGLKTVIAEKKAANERVHVLDIGTGTGLLSLMAAHEGADKVTSLEVFSPMAECATRITQGTEWKDKITVSMFIYHLGEKPNVIVAEVFDTELNGEGALRTFKEALQNLVQPGCRVVPSTGRVWAVPVKSKFLADFNRVPRLPDVDTNVSCPLGDCPGTSAVFDVQLSQVKPEQFDMLAEPILAFSFNFESADEIIYEEVFDRQAVCTKSGDVDAVMMWWDLDMDGTGKNWIDMAPKWANKDYAWRDHWMQAVYYLPKAAQLEAGETFVMKCCHDEFSMWFSIGSQSIQRPYCSCGMHNLLARQSMFRLNRLLRNTELKTEINKLTVGKRVVFISEGSLLGLLAASSAEHVTIIESNAHFLRILRRYIEHYKLKNVKLIIHADEMVNKPDVILGEPFYLSAMNPWQNLRFWHDVEKIRQDHGNDIDVWPKKGVLCGLLEQFVDLQNIANPVGTVNGFDLSYFDEISQKAREATDSIIDEQPLWEYGGTARGRKFSLMEFDLSKTPADQFMIRSLEIASCTNAIPMWMEWQFEDVVISTGLKTDTVDGSEPQWNEGIKQGVYLIPPKLQGMSKIDLKLQYSDSTGDIIFSFS